MSMNNMKVIALGGCGGMGRYAVRTALGYDFVKEILIADLDEKRGQALVAGSFWWAVTRTSRLLRSLNYLICAGIGEIFTKVKVLLFIHCPARCYQEE